MSHVQHDGPHDLGLNQHAAKTTASDLEGRFRIFIRVPFQLIELDAFEYDRWMWRAARVIDSTHKRFAGKHEVVQQIFRENHVGIKPQRVRVALVDSLACQFFPRRIHKRSTYNVHIKIHAVILQPDHQPRQAFHKFGVDIVQCRDRDQ